MAKYTSNIDYVQYMLDIAYDDRYYYAHSSDPYSFSCSTLVAKALYECGYFKKDVVPADGAAIGGNDSSPLHKALFAAGFKKYPFADVKMQPGDILTVLPYHVAACVEGNIMVAANGNGNMVDRSPTAITTYDYRLVGTPRWIFRLPENKIHYLKAVDNMTKAESATQYAENIAIDDSHGYSQYSRELNPDTDCSGLVLLSYEHAGVPVWTNGARSTWDMVPVLLATGFEEVTSKVNLSTQKGLLRGDILYVHNDTIQHTALYCGNGNEVEASSSENGGIHGQPGDQTGKEILIQPYRNIWKRVFRYTKDAVRDYLKKGDSGDDVAAMQRMLIILGYSCGSHAADGDFGNSTEKAVKKFQKDYSLTVNGLYDKKTKSKLKSVYKKKVTSKWKAVGTATCKNNGIYFRASANSKTKANLLGSVGKGHRFEVDGKNVGKWIHAKHAVYGVGYIWRTYVVYD